MIYFYKKLLLNPGGIKIRRFIVFNEEKQKELFVLQMNEDNTDYEIVSPNEEYNGFADYFVSLLNVVGEFIPDIEITYSITNTLSNTLFYLTEEKIAKLPDIKNKLLEELSESIDQISKPVLKKAGLYVINIEDFLITD